MTATEPDSLDQLSHCVAEAARSKTALRFAGSSTWLSGGGPFREARLMSLHKLSGVLDYNPGDLVITLLAGTTLAELASVTRAHRQMFAALPYGSDTSSIGALAATASLSPLAFQDLSMRDLVLGTTVVTGTGAITRAGGKVVKNVAGFDLVRLHTGAWGTLGAIAELSLRLHAIPPEDRVVRAAVSEPLNVVLPRLAELAAAIPMQIAIEPDSNARLLQTAQPARVAQTTQPTQSAQTMQPTQANQMPQPLHAPQTSHLLYARISGNSSRVRALLKKLQQAGTEAPEETRPDALNNLRETPARDTVVRLRAAPSDAMALLRAADQIWPDARMFYSPGRGTLRLSMQKPAAQRSMESLTNQGPTACISQMHEPLNALMRSYGARHAASLIVEQGRTKARSLSDLEAGIKQTLDPHNICNPAAY